MERDVIETMDKNLDSDKKQYHRKGHRKRTIMAQILAPRHLPARSYILDECRNNFDCYA